MTCLPGFTECRDIPRFGRFPHRNAGGSIPRQRLQELGISIPRQVSHLCGKGKGMHRHRQPFNTWRKEIFLGKTSKIGPGPKQKNSNPVSWTLGSFPHFDRSQVTETRRERPIFAQEKSSFGAELPRKEDF
jgi:hypothetical protein